MSFIKLHASILDSSVWLEDDKTRIVWFTLMAMADRDGVIEASVPGLAHRARVARAACERAIEIFMSPDADSRTETDDGRRIEKVNGGWRLINYQPYRDKASPAEVREKNAKRQREWRERNAITPVTALRNATSRSITSGDAGNDIVEAEAEGSPDLPPSDPSRGSAQDQTPARSESRAGIWNGRCWLNLFGPRWCEKYGGLQYGGGLDAAKASGQLSEQILELAPADALAAQARAGAMIAEFLADDAPLAAKARHPFSWFVTRWNGLRVPATTAAKPKIVESFATIEARAAREAAERTRISLARDVALTAATLTTCPLHLYGPREDRKCNKRCPRWEGDLAPESPTKTLADGKALAHG